MNRSSQPSPSTQPFVPIAGVRAARRAPLLALLVLITVIALLGCANTEPLEVDRAHLDPLLEAGDRAAVEALLDQGMDPVFALVRAARVGAVEMVSYLLERGADPNGSLADGYRSTALMAGATGNHPQVVPLLVAAGADLDQVDSVGDPALNWAAYMGQVEYAQALLEAGARADIRSVHGSAFEIALRQGWALLIKKLGAPAEQGLDAAGRDLLTAVEAGDEAAAVSALWAGASARLRTGAGIPLLCVAAEVGHPGTVEMLLAAGAEVEAPDPIGFTPVVYAARAGKVEALRQLAAAGAQLEHVAEPGGMGMTALHMAAAKGQTAAVQALLDLGVVANAVNIRGESALMWSLTEGHPETGLALLAAGADPDLAGESEYSARQAAVDYGYGAVVEAMEAPNAGES